MLFWYWGLPLHSFLWPLWYPYILVVSILFFVSDYFLPTPAPASDPSAIFSGGGNDAWKGMFDLVNVATERFLMPFWWVPATFLQAFIGDKYLDISDITLRKMPAWQSGLLFLTMWFYYPAIVLYDITWFVLLSWSYPLALIWYLIAFFVFPGNDATSFDPYKIFAD